MNRRKELKRKTRLQAKPTPAKHKNPLPKSNPRQATKRKERMRKWYASAEWKRQRKESLELAEYRCEQTGPPIGTFGVTIVVSRCEETTNLHVHELRYKFGKSNPKDRQVLCMAHHELVEMRDHPTRQRRRS